MANVKLSQIAVSPSNAAPADQFVGVHAGTTDFLFTPAQLQVASDPTADGNYYVRQNNAWTKIGAGFSFTYNGPTLVTTTTYVAQTTDVEIFVSLPSAAVSITLPTASAYLTAQKNPAPLVIKDVNGLASVATPITINRTGTDMIDGAASVSITTPFGSAALRPAGPSGNWVVEGVTGVTSVNGLKGALNVTAGNGILVTPSGSNIQVSGAQFSPTVPGDVPAPGTGPGLSTNFLRADGTWQIPPGGGGGGVSVTVSDTPPASPANGALWWDSVSGNLYIWYVDPNTSQWVIVLNASTIAQATPLPTQQIFLTGSGTYNTPAGCRRIEVRLVGGGGGGSGGTPGGNAGSTTFGALTGGGGFGGATNGFAGGGTASGGSVNINGSSGGLGCPSLAGSFGSVGGPGGTSPFGGMGCGGYNNAAGTNAAANSGSGGGGGGATSAATVGPAGGGASGGYVEAAINAPAATYSYAVGAGGNGAAASGGYSAAGNGGSGIIIVKEFY
jgi:hypothetical protein